MPNNVGFSSTPGFSSGGSDPLVRDWVVNPSDIVAISSVNDDAVPARVFFNVTFKDLSQTAFAVTHDTFIGRVVIIQDSSSPDLIAPVLGLGAVSNDIDLVDNVSPFYIGAFDFAFVTLLPSGSYQSSYRFEIYGTNLVTNEVELLEFKTMDVELQRVGEYRNAVVPNRVRLVYLKNSGALRTEVLQVIAAREQNTNQWIMDDPAALDITVTNGTPRNTIPPDIFSQLDQAVTITPNVLWSNRPAGFYRVPLNIDFRVSDELYGIDCGVFVFDAPGI